MCSLRDDDDPASTHFLWALLRIFQTTAAVAWLEKNSESRCRSLMITCEETCSPSAELCVLCPELDSTFSLGGSSVALQVERALRHYGEDCKGGSEAKNLFTKLVPLSRASHDRQGNTSLDHVRPRTSVRIQAISLGTPTPCLSP